MECASTTGLKFFFEKCIGKYWVTLGLDRKSNVLQNRLNKFLCLVVGGLKHLLVVQTESFTFAQIQQHFHITDLC